MILKLRNHTKQKFKKKIKHLKLLQEYGYITDNEFEIMVSSYKGHLKWGSCKELYYKAVNN